MTNHMQFSLTPPSFWQAACQTGRNFFHSADWQTLLATSFGTKTIYAWSNDQSICIAIPVFRVGPFRIGYIGFPVGGGVNSTHLDDGMLNSLQNSKLPTALHLLRAPASQLNGAIQLNFSSAKTPETYIPNLQDWSESTLRKRVRRDINKSLRSNLHIKDANSGTEAGKLYSLYRATIERKTGNLRYNLEYFRSLTALACNHPKIRCMIAISQDEIAGFATIVLSNNVAYYLHGGTNHEFRHLCPSDLLLYCAIKWAQEQDMEYFNLMTSPTNQPSLVKYKEKWGGITKDHLTYEIPIKNMPAAAFKGLTYIHRLFSTLNSGDN